MTDNRFTNRSELIGILVLAVFLVVILPLCLDVFRLNLVAKYLTYAFVSLQDGMRLFDKPQVDFIQLRVSLLENRVFYRPGRSSLMLFRKLLIVVIEHASNQKERERVLPAKRRSLVKLCPRIGFVSHHHGKQSD